jgi:hypothetical protein
MHPLHFESCVRLRSFFTPRHEKIKFICGDTIRKVSGVVTYEDYVGSRPTGPDGTVQTAIYSDITAHQFCQDAVHSDYGLIVGAPTAETKSFDVTITAIGMPVGEVAWPTPQSVHAALEEAARCPRPSRRPSLFPWEERNHRAGTGVLFARELRAQARRAALGPSLAKRSREKKNHYASGGVLDVIPLVFSAGGASDEAVSDLLFELTRSQGPSKSDMSTFRGEVTCRLSIALLRYSADMASYQARNAQRGL